MTPALLAILAETGEGGGFNPLDLHGLGGMLWTLIIFAASMPFVWKVVMGPVTKALLARDERAAAAVLAAEQAKADAEKARADVEARLAEARAEAVQMVDAARARAEVRERELTDQAKKASEDLLLRARAEIRAEQDKAVSQIRAQVVDLSLKAAGKVLERRVDSTDDKRLVEELVTASQGGRK
jgi:F-type H+-transporting ATPase subunit b